ncbi:MAG: YCF48-related protein [Ignavibacteria bacterium]
MKFKLISLSIIIFMCATGLYSQSNWFWQQPTPTGNFLWAVDFINVNTGYAVGTVGTVIKTTNGGGNWELKNTSDLLLRSTNFYDENFGFAVTSGNGSILRSTNGGTNWTEVFSGATTTMWDINFPTRNIGYAVGLAGLILKSTDSGVYWFQQNSGTGSNLYNVDFIDSLNGVVGGNVILSKTSNGGQNWISQSIGFINPFTQISSVEFVDQNTIYGLASGDNRMYKTTDGGNSWNGLPLPLTGNDIERNISFADVNNGIMVTDFGYIEKTTDGAVTWIIDSSFKPRYPQIAVLRNVDYVDLNNAYVSGSGGRIIKTTNGGINWNTTTGGRTNLTSNNFTNENTGFTVGNDGTILKTTNAGTNWILRSSNTIQNLNSVHFPSSNTGYICGDTGIILKTIDAGENWIALNSNVIKNLKSVFFIDENTGTCVGREGAILKTINGGINWNDISSPLGSYFTSVFFVDLNTGVAVSELGPDLRTINGGINWISVVAGTFDVFFTDHSTGYSTAASGNITKTTNSGESWLTYNTGQTDIIQAIYFINSESGFAVGREGSVSKTTNGGIAWTTQAKITNNFLNTVYFTNPNTGYIAGDFGTLLKTTNGGLVFILANNEIIPQDYSLNQNYPNPFNSSTVIKYKINKTSEVNLKLYNIAGKEISTLVNQVQTSGAYEILFNSQEITSGVYFYSLLLNNNLIDTKKLIITK